MDSAKVKTSRKTKTQQLIVNSTLLVCCAIMGSCRMLEKNRYCEKTRNIVVCRSTVETTDTSDVSIYSPLGPAITNKWEVDKWSTILDSNEKASGRIPLLGMLASILFVEQNGDVCAVGTVEVWNGYIVVLFIQDRTKVRFDGKVYRWNQPPKVKTRVVQDRQLTSDVWSWLSINAEEELNKLSSMLELDKESLRNMAINGSQTKQP